ncbi:MAG: hypothetical protein HQK96_08075 [Nitrospirae bacterium]|nr:hypothetical protein [Nitrospirota bacterium]
MDKKETMLQLIEDVSEITCDLDRIMKRVSKLIPRIVQLGKEDITKQDNDEKNDKQILMEV